MADIELEVLSRAIMTGGIDQMIAAGVEARLISRMSLGVVPDCRPDLGPCYVWTGSIKSGTSSNGGGYGRLGDDYAHRLSYQTFVGEIPAGLEIDHLCRNRACVRPDHLEAVTCRENQLRGEGWAAFHARKTHCKHGHEFTPENTYRHRGHRYCRACRKRNRNRG